MAKKPNLSIIILSYNGLLKLKRCIASIKKQTLKDIELIIVDNGSNNDVIDYLKQLNGIKVIRLPSNQGMFGFNVGLINAKSDYIALLDQDEFLTNNWASLTLKELESEPLSTAVINTNKIEGNFEFASKRQYNNAFGGTGCIIRKKIIDEGFLFNEKFFIYEHESELSMRLKNRGYNFLYYPGAYLVHDKPERKSNISQDKFSHYYHYRNALWNIWIHFPWYMVPFDTLMKLSVSFFKCVVYGNILTFFRVLIDGFMGLPYCLKKREVAKYIAVTTFFDIIFRRNRIGYPPDWVRIKDKSKLDERDKLLSLR